MNERTTPDTLWARSVDERLVMLIILINSVTIFLRAFPNIRAHYDFWLLVIDYGCTLYFIYELGCKYRLLGGGPYFQNAWNRFDFAVVLLSLPMLFSPFFDTTEFSAVLLLRIARLLRFFRLLRFIPDVDRVFDGVKRGIKASIGVFLALALYNFALGLAGCYIFGAVSPEHFGDPVVSMYSIFKVFTVEGWFEIPDAIATSHPTYGLLAKGYFMFAVSTGGLLGFSMANAVFVDEMVMDNNLRLEQEVDMLAQHVTALTAQQEALLAHLAPARPDTPPGSGRDVNDAIASDDGESDDGESDDAPSEPPADSDS